VTVSGGVEAEGLRWPSPSVRSRLRRLGPAAALAALVALLFHRAALGGEAFFERDIQFDWYPQVESFVRAVVAGSWPVWDTSIAFGQPLWADPSAQVLYPPTWLNLLMRPWTYYTVFVLLHVWLSALGTYRAARALGTSRSGALAAAALWTTSGPLLSMVNLWHHFAGACWLPWVFLTAHRAVESGRARHLLVFAAASAAQILAGSADMCMLTQLLVAALALRRALPPRAASGRVRLLLGVAAAWVLALALTAAQWLPALEAAQRSARWDLPPAERTIWSVAPLGLLQVLAPVFLEDVPLRPAAQRALFESGSPFLSSLYLGLPALALAAAAFLAPVRSHRWLLLVAAISAVMFALGHHTPFYALSTTVLPVLKIFRYPVKAMILPAFAVALLAGMGFDGWRREGRRGRAWLGPIVLLVGVIAMAAGGYVLGEGRRAAWPAAMVEPGAAAALEPVRRQLLLSAGLGALALAAALGARRAAPGRGRNACVSVIAALALADLFLAHHAVNATTPRELLIFKPPVLEAVRQPDHSRLYVYEYFRLPDKSRRYLGREDPYILAANTRLPLPIAQVLSQRLYPAPPAAGRWGLESSYDLDFRRLYPWYLSHLTWLLRGVEETPVHLRLLRMGAVSHVVALHARGLEALVPAGEFPSLFPEPIRLFRVPDPRPRAYAVGAVRVADGEQALAALQDPAFDPAREVLLPSGPATSSGPGFTSACRIVEARPDRMVIDAELGAPGFVVSVDAYDPGWRVRLDGREATAVRANLAFRAVPSPAGRHRIEWDYRPRGVRVGLLVSGIAAVGAAALAWRLRRS
jgi:hypothetical protein